MQTRPIRFRARWAAVGLAFLALLSLTGGCSGCGEERALISLQLTPGAATVADGMTRQFEARAFYDDGTTRVVTELAEWTSSDTAVATVDGAGLATAITPGTAVIRATWNDRGDDATLVVSAAAVESLQIEPTDVEIPVGTIRTFTATATLADGSVVDATADVTWTSSDDDVLAFEGINVARAIAPGSVTVRAELDGVTAVTSLTVTDATLVRILLTPSPANTITAVPVQFRALGIFSDGESQDVTTVAAWASSDESVATIDDGGLATPHEPGTAMITASMMGVTSEPARLDVRSTAIESLQVVPSAAVLPSGASQQFEAYVLLADDTQIEITTFAMWSSTAPDIVRVTQTGIATALAAQGGATIRATLAGHSGEALVTITDATLETIEIDPPTVTDLPMGATFQLRANGRFSDGTTRDLTEAATWTSSHPAFASVSNTASTRGLVTAVAAGSAEVRASFGEVHSAPVAINVRADEALAFITLSPPTATMNKGEVLQFRAVGHYTDGSTFDLTHNAAWSAVASDSMTAVTELVVVRGLVTAIASTAALPGGNARVRVESDGIFAFADVTVRDTDVVALDVDCSAPVRLECVPADIGYEVRCAAVATYSDNTTSDVSHRVTWSSSAADVALYSGMRDGRATFTAVGSGAATVRATIDGISSAMSGDPDATIRAIDATLDSMLVIPPDARINLGRTQQYQAHAMYRSSVAGCGDGPDAYPVTVTELSSWSSSHPARVQVSNTAGRRGLATALSPGRAQIQAFFQGMVGAAQVDILDACIDHLSITPSKLVLPTEVIHAMSAVAVMSDGSVEALTPGQSGLEWTTAAIDPQSWMLDTGALGGGSHAIQLAANPAVGTCSGEVERAQATIGVEENTTLTGLSIAPPSATIPTSGSASFAAEATFAGFAGAFNVTPYAMWEDPDALTAHGLSADRATRIFSAGVTEGSTTITAAYRHLTALGRLTVSGATVASVEIIAIHVGPDGTNLLGETFPVNLQLRFVAQVHLSNGAVLRNPNGLQFESSDPTKLDFAVGPFTARTRAPSGETHPTVVARFAGVQSARVPVRIGSGALVDLSFSPDPVFLPVNAQQPLTVRGTWSGIARSYDISDAVVCTSSNTALLQVSTNSAGIRLHAGPTATQNTPTQVTCVKNGAAESVDVFVRDSCVTGVTLSPAAADLPQGEQRDFTAFAHFSDGHSDAHIAASGTWTSSNPAVLAVREPVADHARRYEAIAPGNATVSFQLDAGFDGLRVCAGGDLAVQSVTGNATVRVQSAAIESVRILPAPIGNAAARRVPLGESLQLRAMARLTNGQELDVTQAPGTVWSAQDPARASVASAGTLTAHAVGLTVVDVHTANQKTASLSIAVQDCGLPTVAIAADASGKLPLGLQRRFTASAFYDGSLQGCDADQAERSFPNVTARVQWSSSAPAVLGIATGGATAGVATAVSAGIARVRAQYRGASSPYIDVPVVNVQLQTLQIQNGSPIETFVGAGGAVDLDLVAEYSDGVDTFILQPPNVTWLIVDPTVVTVDAAHRLTGLKVGSTTLRAQAGAIVSEPRAVTVSPACITGVEIVEPIARTFPAGVPFELTASCETSDGSALPCQPRYEVTAGAAVVDDFSGDFLHNGVLRIASDPAGSAATLRAYVDGCTGLEQDTTTVFAGSATLREIAVSPSEITIPRGTRTRITTHGTYAGGTGLGTYELTRVAHYHSSNPTVATADNDRLGHVTAGNIDGTAFISASYDGITSDGAYLTVSGKQLVALAVQAEANCTGVLGPDLEAAYPAGGFRLNLAGIATYSDGSSGLLVDPIWSLVSPIVTGTSISSTGQLTTGSGSGTQRVRIAKDSVVAFFDVGIVGGAIASITLTGPESVPNGVTAEFDAAVTLVGTSTTCSTNTYAARRNVFWASSDPTRGSIVVSGTNAGRFTAHASTGFVEVTATRGTATGGPVVVDLTSATPIGARCEPASVTTSVGATGRVRAAIDYSDGTTLMPMLSQAQWSASIQSGADRILFASDFEPGVFAATAPGVAEIRPTLNGVPVTQACFVTVN